VHFHWAEGTRGLDGLPADHPAEFDKLYFDALDIDYQALDAAQESAIRTLRLGTIRVLTPAGTDVMFRAGIRKFNRQNGDASPARAKAAQMRVDREIELPAGAIRLAPIEDGVAGQIVLPEARFGGVTAKRVVLQLDNGRITRIAAAEGLEAVKEALAKGGDAAMRFREFALGFNPRLAVEPGSRIVPYYGYGAGVVRLSLGGNGELGGSVAGDFARWLFFTDASVHVDFRYVVKNGRLGM
jgi:leucyl aminopeptidase (aminopeptidase T)